MIALEIIRLIISPMPMERRPGFLSSGINLHAVNASNELSFHESLTNHNLRANFAISLHKFLLLSPNEAEVNIRLHPTASKFEGPDAPFIWLAILLINSHSIVS